MKNNRAMVSVCMITYNHENYIREAIEGVLMQKTDFPIELIIGEDCSTDSTRKIVVEYAEKYPDLIRPLLPESNLGMMKNFIKTMEAAKGKYIALCEGDDYWTDPYKLQKQVDFLEANEEYSGVFHNIMIFDSKDNNIEGNTDTVEGKFTFLDILQNNMVATLSLVFRNTIELPIWLEKMQIGDWYLHLINTQLKPYYCFKKIMGVYRKTNYGMFSSKIMKEKVAIRLNFYSNVIKYFDKKYHRICKKKLSALFFSQGRFEVEITRKFICYFKSIYYNPRQIKSIAKYFINRRL